MDDFLTIYESELTEHVLPFWMRHSLDREHGGYFTGLTADGRVYDDRKYMWLQGRQVWMLARLYNTYEPREEWLEASRLGADFIRRFGRLDDGRVYFSLTREGQPQGLQRKPFSECFYAMAMAEYYRATGDALARDEAAATFSVIEQLIADPARLGRPVLAGSLRMHSLAIPMIMLNLLEEMRGILAPETIEAKAAACVQAMLRHYDPQLRLLREHVGEDGGDSLEAFPEGRLINPGHSIEAAWFLLHYAAAREDQALQARSLEILEGSLEFGWDEAHGGLLYFKDVKGFSPAPLEHDMKLWWPHTEAIYALVAAWCATGEQRYADWLQRVHDYSFRHFVDHEHGEWFGYCNRRGEVTHQTKGGAYKGCFHVPRALLFSVQALRRHAASGAELKTV